MIHMMVIAPQSFNLSSLGTLASERSAIKGTILWLLMGNTLGEVLSSALKCGFATT
jgi:hypothetical protein